MCFKTRWASTCDFTVAAMAGRLDPRTTLFAFRRNDQFEELFEED